MSALLWVGCQKEEAPGGLARFPDAPPPGQSAPPLSKNTEPALAIRTEGGARKLFIQGLRAVRYRDFSSAATFFQNARQRHELHAGRDTVDEFVYGCEFYMGRVNEGLFQFETARNHYDRIPASSSYRPYAAERTLALIRDSDGDGYVDAWEEAEGTGPDNPLSHP